MTGRLLPAATRSRTGPPQQYRKGCGCPDCMAAGLQLEEVAPLQPRPSRGAARVQKAAQIAAQGLLIVAAAAALIGLMLLMIWISVDHRLWVPYAVSALLGGPAVACICCWYLGTLRRPR